IGVAAESVQVHAVVGDVQIQFCPAGQFRQRVISTFLSSDSKAAVYPLAELAGWAELDLNITNNSVHLNGFSSNPDSVAHYLDIFSAQEPQAIGVPGIVPARTAVLVHLGISNFRQFYHDRLAYYDQSNLPHDYRQYVEQLQAHCDCDPEEKLLTWVQQEVALVIPEPPSPQAPITSLLVLKAQDVDRAVESLTSLYRGPADSLLVENYRGFPIRKLGFRGPYRPFLGEVFGNPDHTHYTVIRNYMVFANGPRQLHRFINDYLKERTLSKDPHYHVYAENISGESNVFIYSNVGRSPDVYRHFVTEEYQQDIDLRKELFRQFESAAIQISREREGLFYQSISLKHNPVYQPDQAARWEIQLDTGILQRPNLVRNHYTKAYELAVQDAANALYLIDNSGTIQWKRSLKNRIISDIRQIDVFGNDKLQLLFNTRTHLHCIDRLGRDVEGFPVKLPAPASAPVTILDYDGKHHYRLLVPCKDGMVRNYNKQGKPVKGWSFKAMKAPVTRAVQHHVLGDKDYLVAVDRDGRVRITDRKGEERIAVKAKLPLAPGSPFFINPADEATAIRIIGTDTLGQVIGLDFGGEAHLEAFDTLVGNYYFDYRDVDGDGNADYLFATATQVRAYDREHNRILDIVPDSAIVGAPAYFEAPDGGNFFVAIRTGSNDEIWVYDRQGILRNDTPYTGSTPLTLDDLDQNRQPDLIVGDRGNFIHAFRID
ncbi:MAG: DUF3352 domain-containing protein, partial [Bacteroidota bacterium]